MPERAGRGMGKRAEMRRRIAAVAVAALCAGPAAAQVEMSVDDARGLAITLEAQGQREAAASVAGSLLANDPNDVTALIVLARVRRAGGDIDGALQAARRRTRMPRRMTNATRRRGTGRRQLHRGSRAYRAILAPPRGAGRPDRGAARGGHRELPRRAGADSVVLFARLQRGAVVEREQRVTAETIEIAGCPSC